MKLVFPRLYAIMDAAFTAGSELALAETLSKAGVELIQYRDKQGTPRHLFDTAVKLVSSLHARGVRVIVNDRPDIALLAGAGGVHVGQDDLPPTEVRSIVGPSCWVGVSTHSLDEVREAADSSADYIAVGPIFPTSTKERPSPVVGLDFIRRARALTEKPLIAIGGITLERAADVFAAGADSLAVARDLLTAADAAAHARSYLEVASNLSAP